MTLFITKPGVLEHHKWHEWHKSINEIIANQRTFVTESIFRYHKASKQSMELHTLARYISELCLLDYSIALELPSQVAMACLYVALRMNSLVWTEEIQLVTGAKVKDILPLAERINSILLKAYHTNNNFNVKSKYAHEVFFQVALKRPMVSMTTTKER